MYIITYAHIKPNQSISVRSLKYSRKGKIFHEITRRKCTNLEITFPLSPPVVRKRSTHELQIYGVFVSLQNYSYATHLSSS